MAIPGLGSRINGKYYDFSSIEVTANGIVSANVSSIEYKHSMTVGKFRGTSAKIRGRTRGTYDAEGSMSMYIEDWEKLKAALVALGLGGFMMAEFTITCSYREIGANVPILDTLLGCRVIDSSKSHSEGEDSLKVDLKLDIVEILENGMSAVDAAAGGGVAGIIAGAVGGLL